MRVVEDFIKMMESNYEEYKSDLAICEYGKCNNECRQENEIFVSSYANVIESTQYKALKATIDKQEEVKDMKCTTVEGYEIVVGECYETRDGRKAFVSFIGNFISIVVDIQPVKVIIVGNCMNTEYYHNGRVFKGNDSGADLMRPWKEDKQKLVVTDGAITVAIQKWFGRVLREDEIRAPEYRSSMRSALQAVFDMVNSSTSEIPTDSEITEEKPLDDGWLPHTTGEQPVGDDVMVEYRNGFGTHAKLPAIYLIWSMDDSEYDIIAYRIISEPKKEQSNVCTCDIPTKCWGGLKGLCGMCHKIIEEPESAPTPKQTLLEWVYGELSNKSPGFKYEATKNGGLIQLLSEYLETRLK